MKRKWLVIVVSILAVVLLVMGSLSNVVGYQSVKSSVSDSPLFQTRTQRATNQQQNSITSQYLGRDKSHNLLILPRLDAIGSSRDVISKIQTMDDASFQRFVRITVLQLSTQNKFKDVTPQQLVIGLNQIRNNPQTFIDYSRSIDGETTIQPTPSLCWFPGCFLLLSIIIIILYITGTFDTYNVCGK
jgi:hypothetical protein